MDDQSDSTVERRASEGELCSTVARTVAAAKGVDTDSLTPLYTVVDPEALTELFENRSTADGFVTFTWEDCRVTVDSDRHVIAEFGTDIEGRFLQHP